MSITSKNKSSNQVAHEAQDPAPWDQADPKLLQKIRGVCLDIDDTLSTHGKLTSQAYESLEELQKAGFKIVPVTGRPAGWCDHIARFWPVDAVVGENGAFAFFMENGIRKTITTPTALDFKQNREKLTLLREKILLSFPEALWASDQSYRDYDLAIDICEDVPTWPNERVEALLQLCHNEGAHAKLSSIHVNTWYGDYDKQKGFTHWLSRQESAPSPDEWIYIGDSPNDEPLFKFFKYSVGVANLKKYLPRLQFKPTWLTSQECGQGFAEMAARLVRLGNSQRV